MKKQTKSCFVSAIVLGGLLVSNFVAFSAQAQTSITRVSSFEYNAQGLLVQEVIEPDNAQACLTTTHDYDGFGNKKSVSTAACTGASGATLSSAGVPRVASTTYTADGRFPAITANSLGHTESKTYDERFGLPKALTGPNQLTTNWDYDGFGRKKKETRSDGTYTTWDYKYCTEGGCPTSLTAAGVGASGIGGAILHQTPAWYVTERSYSNNNVEIAAYKTQYHDALGRVIRVETLGFDGAGSAAPILVQDTAYNALGQIARKSNTYDSTQPATAVWVNYQYDQLGRLIQESAPDNTIIGSNIATTVITYAGLSSTITNSKNQTKTTLKDALGRTSKVTDHYGNTVEYAYDALGQLTQTNAGGNITTIRYNIRGQKEEMQDPAMGVWTYAYNAFGELVSQTDSLSKVSSIEYDRLGRMTKRIESDLVSTWSYDSCAMGKGKLCQASTLDGNNQPTYNRVHSYDSQGRPSSTATKLDVTVTTSVSYEAASGRVASKTYPTGYVANYTYTQLGYLKIVTGQGAGAAKQAKYEILQINAQGQITQYRQGSQLGSQIITNKTYNQQTGRLETITATKDGAATGGIQTNSYEYDSLSNLTKRVDSITGVQENFNYDQLNRLTSYNAVGGAVTAADPSSAVQVMYDARGNISYKSDVGSYWYDPARPNRLASITLDTAPGASANTGKRRLVYAFDDYLAGAKPMQNGLIMGNGNLMYTVSQDVQNNRHTVRWEEHTSFNMISQIRFGALVNSQNPTNTVASRTLTFVYGPEHQRIMQRTQVDSSAPSSMRSSRVYYLNGQNNDLGYEKEVTDSGMTEHKHYLSAGGIVFAMQITRSGTLGNKPVENLQYLHHDHLGSVAVVTDADGSVAERLAFDPWGKRRFPNGLADKDDTIVGLTLDRGYTMHEHLDEMGLIHMNGRIYDPLIGRFMSADPFIQAPENLQSHNRFSYVMNNPLSYTDPSGYFSLKKLLRGIAAIAIGVWTGGAVSAWIASSAGTAAGAAAAAAGASTAGIAAASTMATMAAATAVSTGIISGMVGGFAAGLVGSGGDLKAGLLGALSGGMFGGVGASFNAGSFGSYAGHAVTGCITSVAGGGACGSGAASALFGKFATNMTNGIQSDLGRGVAAVVAGGVGSVIAGGKFENGAVTAAYGYLFNHCAHNNCFSGEKNPFYGDKNFHEYQTWSPICESGAGSCSEQAVFQRGLRECPTPGACVSGGVNTGDRSTIQPFPGFNKDVVSHVVDQGNLAIFNITQEGHRFHFGYAYRYVTTIDGIVGIVTYGTGNGAQVTFNRAFAAGGGWQTYDNRIVNRFAPR